MYGGTVSHSPEFPQQVVNVGSKFKNLLYFPDITRDVSGVECNVENGNISINGTNTNPVAHILISMSNKIDFKIGKTYTFSKSKTTTGIYSQFIYFNGTTNVALGWLGDTKSVTFTIPNDFVQFINFAFYSNPNATTINEEFTVQLEEGSTATDYMPYGVSEVNVKVQNKNFINIEQLTETTYNGITFTPIYENGLLKYINVNGTANEEAYYDFSPNNYLDNTKNYILSGCPVNGSINTYKMVWYTYTENNAYVNGNTDIGEGIAINLTGAYRTRILIYVKSGTTVNNLKFYPMIREVTSDSSYEPHQEQTATLTLPSGMELCKIGNYQDSFVRQEGKWYKNKKIGKVIFNGSEDWNIYNSSTSRTALRIDIDDIESYTSASDTPNIVSSRFIPVSYNATWNIGSISRLTSSQKRIIVCYEPNTTAEAFKIWLSTHNVSVYYVLATPVLEEITDTTLIEQLDNLANLYSYKGTTIISSDDEISPIFDVEYYKDIELMIQNLLNQ